MNRAQAEAIYDSGRERCVEFLLELTDQVKQLIEQVAVQEARIAEQDAQIARQEARIAELEERLAQNSSNSSLPPSKDPPQAPPRRSRSKSARKPGGQPGHPGKSRTPFAPEQVDKFVDHWPARCDHCDHELEAQDHLPARKPQRHQVAELPEISVSVTEHLLHRVRCPNCGRQTRAKLPDDVPDSAFGTRICAAIAGLSVRNRISRRDIPALCWDLFRCPISVGSVQAICERMSEALEQPHAQLIEAIQGSAVVNADETGWHQAAQRRWLWGGFTPKLAALIIMESRGQASATKLLGENFKGVVVSDRWNGYNHFDLLQRALCWAHLIRDFRKLSERVGIATEIGEQALMICERLFEAWHTYQEHGHERNWLATQIDPLQAELRIILERGKEADKKTKALCRNLLKTWVALWTFTEHDGVEPTNNSAERGLRSAVIYRKLSFGTQSDQGTRFVERMLSVATTCRLQNRSLFTYLTEVMTAHTQGDAVPLLTA